MLEMSDLKHLGMVELRKISFEHLSNAELREGLLQSLDYTAKYFFFLGKIWVELEKRGENLSEFKNGIIQFLPYIGKCQLLPELVLRFSSQIMLLNQLRKLHPKVQEKILAGEKFDLASYQDGKIKIFKIPIDELITNDHPIFFDEGKIRPVEEQKKILLKYYQPRTQRTVRHKTIKIDRAKGVLKIHQTEVLLEDIYVFFADYTGNSLADMKKLLKPSLKNK